MRIENYDDDNYMIVVDKKRLERLGFREGDSVYVFDVDSGLIAVVKKSSFRRYLKGMVVQSINSKPRGVYDFSAMSDDERELLVKISELEFGDRTREHLIESLGISEEMIKRLVDHGYLRAVDRDGVSVFVIPKPVYVYLRSLRKDERPSSTVSPKFSKASSPKVNNKALVDKLNKEGYLVLSNEAEARALTPLLKEQVSAGEVLGVRGFDLKYYVFTRKFYSSAHNKIVGFLESVGSATLERVAEGVSLPPEVCKGVLSMLLEKGDVYESKDGAYKLV